MKTDDLNSASQLIETMHDLAEEMDKNYKKKKYKKVKKIKKEILKLQKQIAEIIEKR